MYRRGDVKSGIGGAGVPMRGARFARRAQLTSVRAKHTEPQGKYNPTNGKYYYQTTWDCSAQKLYVNSLRQFLNPD